MMKTTEGKWLDVFAVVMSSERKERKMEFTHTYVTRAEEQLEERKIDGTD